MSDEMLIKGGLYKHYKGGLYTLLHFANLEADESEVCVYVSLSDERIWVRPIEEFRLKFSLLND